jgi:hypothetical protein
LQVLHEARREVEGARSALRKLEARAQAQLRTAGPRAAEGWQAALAELQSLALPDVRVSLQPLALITAFSYAKFAGNVQPLPRVPAEAAAIAAAFPPHATRTLEEPSIAEFAAALPGKSTWFFLGHGNKRMGRKDAALFVGPTESSASSLQAVSATALATAIASRADRLSLVVLNSCCTEPLATTILATCSTVSHVVCWATRTHDDAAAAFGRAFAAALARRGARGVRRAFEDAKAELLQVQQLGHVGFPVGVSEYAFVDPSDPRVQQGRVVDPDARGRDVAPIAAGVPKLLSRAGAP